jgi:hypothetical protein
MTAAPRPPRHLEWCAREHDWLMPCQRLLGQTGDVSWHLRGELNGQVQVVVHDGVHVLQFAGGQAPDVGRYMAAVTRLMAAPRIDGGPRMASEPGS